MKPRTTSFAMSAARVHPKWKFQNCSGWSGICRGAFARRVHFFDLPDYLSFRATGSAARSICTLGCKWNYLAHDRRWSDSYFERIGLGDLASENYAKIGNEIAVPGTPLGAGLT